MSLKTESTIIEKIIVGIIAMFLSFWALIGLAIVTLGTVFVISMVLSIPAWLLWNWVIVTVFAFPHITWIQAWGIVYLSNILFKSKSKWPLDKTKVVRNIITCQNKNIHRQLRYPQPAKFVNVSMFARTTPVPI